VLWEPLTAGNDIRSGDQGRSEQEAHPQRDNKKLVRGAGCLLRRGDWAFTCRIMSGKPLFMVSRAADITEPIRSINRPSGKPISQP
jgi:hypothetical protein